MPIYPGMDGFDSMSQSQIVGIFRIQSVTFHQSVLADSNDEGPVRKL